MNLLDENIFIRAATILREFGWSCANFEFAQVKDFQIHPSLMHLQFRASLNFSKKFFRAIQNDFHASLVFRADRIPIEPRIFRDEGLYTANRP